MAAWGRSLGHARLRVGYCLCAISQFHHLWWWDRVSDGSSRLVREAVLDSELTRCAMLCDGGSFPLHPAAGSWRSVPCGRPPDGARGDVEVPLIRLAVPFSHFLDLNSDEMTP